MKEPKRKKLTVKQVAKNYKKNVKVKNKPTSVMNYQTGTDPKMDKMVNKRMGKVIPAGSSYSGPVIETTRKIKNTSKPKSVTYGVNKPTGGGTMYKKGKKGL
jgi:hypothetical protein